VGGLVVGAHEAMTSGRRFGGLDAARTCLVDEAVALPALRAPQKLR
jgi:hypothetical protein